MIRDSTNRAPTIYMAMPGNSRNSQPFQRQVEQRFRSHGIKVRHCLQINSFLNGGHNFPGVLDPADVGAGTAFRRCLDRDYTGDGPDLAYWDYEPKDTTPAGQVISLLYRLWTADADADTIDLAHAAVDEIEAEAPDLPLAMYGVPFTSDSGPSFFDFPRYKRPGLTALLGRFDFVMPSLYARSSIIRDGFSAEGTIRRVVSTVTACRQYGQRVIPIVRFQPWPGGEEPAYAEAIVQGLIDAQCREWIIWDNPKNEAMGRYVCDRIDAASPALQRFAEGGW